jgi:precorrin-4 methylase
MEAFLNWLLEQAPVVVVAGAWIYSLFLDRNYHRDRADKKDDNDKNIFERMITSVTESTSVMKEVIEIVKGNNVDHSNMKENIAKIETKLITIETKLEIINTKING